MNSHTSGLFSIHLKLTLINIVTDHLKKYFKSLWCAFFPPTVDKLKAMERVNADIVFLSIQVQTSSKVRKILQGCSSLRTSYGKQR